MVFFIFLSFRFYKIAKQPTVLSMQHAPVKSADGKMVLARQANLTPTSAGDIRKKLQEGTFLFGYLLQLTNVGIIIASLCCSARSAWG